MIKPKLVLDSVERESHRAPHKTLVSAFGLWNEGLSLGPLPTSPQPSLRHGPQPQLPLWQFVGPPSAVGAELLRRQRQALHVDVALRQGNLDAVLVEQIEDLQKDVA